MTSDKSNTAFAPKSNSSVSVLPYPYIGFVKNNDDPQMMGRLAVWIPELCGDPLNEGSWIICTYCSPFAGATNINELENYQSPTTQTVSQQSYGWVGIPPDINTEVMVVFAGGKISQAYWTGCIFQQNMNHMVPGIASDTTQAGQTNSDGGTLPTVVPVMEYNKANGVTGSPTNVNRPIFQPLATGLMREGLLNDLERGAASTSMRREAPPLMSGWLSPRGNTVHIDDSATNEFIRLRTRSGAQILIHETTGYVYINSKNGNAWLEVSDTGINGYTANALSFRAGGDINLIAGGAINMNASNINMLATSQINMSAATVQIGSTGNLTLSATSNINTVSGANWVRNAAIIQDSATTIQENATEVFIFPEPIYEETTPGTATPATPPASTTVSDTSTTSSGSGTGVWAYGASSIKTIAGVVPTHEPWPGHPNADIPPLPTTNTAVISNGNGVGPGGATGADGSSAGDNGLPPAPGTAATDACSFGAANTHPISTIVFNAIQTAASKTNNSFATMLAFADIETGGKFNPNAFNSGTKASGLFQFIPSTWAGYVRQFGAQYGVPSTQGAVFDPNYNSLMGGQFLTDNANVLQKKGLANTPGNLYIMHLMGPSQGVKFINYATTQASASAPGLFPNEAKGNGPFFFTTSHQAFTMSQAYTNLTVLINSKAQAYATQTGTPAPCTRATGTPSGVSPQINQSSPAAAVASANGLTGKFWWKGGSGQTNVSANRQCVALVQSSLLNLPHTSLWTRGRGDLVNNPPPPGTGIATFNAAGQYTNQHGISHAAIYLGPVGNNGFQVLEQYDQGANPPAHIKTYVVGGVGENNAANYFVINHN